MAAQEKPQKLKTGKDQVVTVYPKMAEEDKEEANQDNVVSYFKSLTLEKKYAAHTITAYTTDLESFLQFASEEFDWWRWALTLLHFGPYHRI